MTETKIIVLLVMAILAFAFTLKGMHDNKKGPS